MALLHDRTGCLTAQNGGSRPGQTGEAFCGSVGKPARTEYCVVGDVVIMSARLMASKSNHGQIFCDKFTVATVENKVEFEVAGDPKDVKGGGIMVKSRKELLPSPFSSCGRS
jgi:hypothetical protein